MNSLLPDRTAWLAAILFITDLFHPIDDLALDMFLDGDMGHGRHRRGAVPVLDGRGNPDDVARADLFHQAAPLLNAADTRRHDENLAERMRVPGAARARLERDRAARRAPRIARREQRIDTHRTGEALGWPRGGRLGAGALDHQLRGLREGRHRHDERCEGDEEQSHCLPFLRRRALPALESRVLVVTDLLHPLDDLAVQRLLDGDMGHRRRCLGAVPVLLAGCRPDHVAWADLLDRTAPALHPAATRRDDQRLAERMGVPIAARARLESDGGSRCTRRLARLEQWVDADRAGEPVGRSAVGRLHAVAFDLHGSFPPGQRGSSRSVVDTMSGLTIACAYELDPYL